MRIIDKYALQYFNEGKFKYLVEFSKKKKSNPNNWIIINKWNFKLYQYYKFKIFKEVEDFLIIYLMMKEYGKIKLKTLLIQKI